MTEITPVILCGGSGTRLWPLSRKSYPKQFVPFLDGATLFQDTIHRLSGDHFSDPLVITASDFRFIVTEQMLATGQDPEAILIEPEGKDTAPAVLAAAAYLATGRPDAVMLIAPSDHVITDHRAFRGKVADALEAALAGEIVTFGIQPDRPATGYGYIEVGEAGGDHLREAVRFVEKPEHAEAVAYFENGAHYWNAGIFLATARTIIEAYEKAAPKLLAPVLSSVRNATSDLGFLRLDAAAWSEIPPISIDHAVMEKVKNVAVMPYAGAWNDLGDWSAVWEQNAEPNSMATEGQVTQIDCQNSLLWSDDAEIEMVGLGLSNTIAVAMGDAVLVADKARSQDVKEAVAKLREKGAGQADRRRREYRPWGWFETLTLGHRYRVKQIYVHPGAALSMQSHVHRAEHWVVVAGSAQVTLGDEGRLISENESIYVPLGSTHRLENPGKVPLHLIEVQTGAYLGEDDIVRYEDRYARLASE